MLDRIEGHLDRLVHGAHFRLIAQFNSELARITDKKQQRWALWYAVADLPPWHRRLILVVIVLVGPLALTSAILGFAATRGMTAGAAWTIVGPLAWGLGVLLTAILIEGLRRRHVRSRCRRAMRVFGHDICTGCGYDMEGHDAESSRTCPECGAQVPPVHHTGPVAFAPAEKILAPAHRIALESIALRTGSGAPTDSVSSPDSSDPDTSDASVAPHAPFAPGDPHAPYQPARWFEEEFGVPPERLRSARRRRRAGLSAVKFGGRWLYSVPAVMHLWPAIVTDRADRADRANCPDRAHGAGSSAPHSGQREIEPAAARRS